MSRIVLLFAASLILLGCSSTNVTTLSWNPQSEPDLERMNRELSGVKATVHLSSGYSSTVESIFLASDSTLGYGLSGYPIRWKTDSITRVAVRNPSTKLVGTLGGAVVGAFVGVLSTPRQDCGTPDPFVTIVCKGIDGTARIASAALFGVIGAALGAVIAPGAKETHYTQNTSRPLQ